MWRAKDEKVDAPPRQWMSEPLEQRKGMVGESGVGKLYAYVMAGFLEAGVWPAGLREFGRVFDVPGTPESILLKDVKTHVKTVLMGHFASLVDTEHGLHPLAHYDTQVTAPRIVSEVVQCE